MRRNSNVANAPALTCGVKPLAVPLYVPAAWQNARNSGGWLRGLVAPGLGLGRIGVFCLVAKQQHRFLALVDNSLIDQAFAHIGQGRQLEHDVEHGAFHHVAQAASARFALNGFGGNGLEGIGRKAQVNILKLKKLLVLRSWVR